ncbi:carbohydrate ABC transporter permease [Ruania rhizosphaerae]|uniref:carbohydrate ABC transporter permease n=1 Tax=Ruania rhizosphaerae TaxID=1840413 RepID=UPI00135A7865|nr:sugar ABC transporter permease [Ruania rhizosphaerae]
MSTSTATGSRRRRHGAVSPWAPYLFVAPFVVLFLLFLVAPIAVAFVNSLFSRQSSGLGFGGSSIEFVGLANFVRAFADRDFLIGFPRVLLYGAVQVPVMMAIAAFFALLFDTALVKGRRFFQFTVFLPYAVPSVIAALLWGFLYQPSVSPVLQFFESVGITLSPLASTVVLWSIANVALWSLVGINMIILFSALQSVPREMYEAARIDGAGEVRTALQIKLPMIAPAVLLTTLSSIIGTLQLFNEPQVLQTITSNIPSDYTPNMAIYATSTLGKDPHLASAMAVILGLATLVVSLLVLAANKRTTNRAGHGL